MEKLSVRVLGSIKYLLSNPGAVAIIGAENHPLLQRTALNEWELRFTENIPWDHIKLDNPLIIKKPTQNKKDVIFANGSKARFIHFTRT